MRELAHLLAPWQHDPRLHLHLLPVATGVRQRPPEERAKRRQLLFRAFFEKTQLLRIGKGQKPIYGWQNAAAGCLAGLLDRQGLLLGVAVVRRIQADGLVLFSPCRSPEQEQLAAVRLGRLRIDPLTGRELHRITNRIAKEALRPDIL